MRRKPKESGDIRVLISLELRIHSEYQSIIKENSEALDLSWIYELKQSRKQILAALLDDYSLHGDGDRVGCSVEKKKNPKPNGHRTDITQYLLEKECEHIAELEKCAGEFYCSPERKKMIIESLLPLAKQNLFKLSQFDLEKKTTTLVCR